MDNPVKNIIEIKFRGKISGEIFKYITITISGVKSASSLKKAVDLKYLENEIIFFGTLKLFQNNQQQLITRFNFPFYSIRYSKCFFSKSIIKNDDGSQFATKHQLW